MWPIGSALSDDLAGNLPMVTARLSSMGQVIIHKDVRDRHSCKPSAELEVEGRGDAVLLRAAKSFRGGLVAQVFSCLR